MFSLFGPLGFLYRGLNVGPCDAPAEPIDELRDLQSVPFELLSANKPSDNSIKLISDAHCR